MIFYLGFLWVFVFKEVFFLWKSKSGGRDIPTSLSYSNGSTCPSVSGMSQMFSPPCPPSLHCSQPGHGRKDADDPKCSYRQTIINYNTNKTILESSWIGTEWPLQVGPRSHCGRREPVSKSYPLLATCGICTHMCI